MKRLLILFSVLCLFITGCASPSTEVPTDEIGQSKETTVIDDEEKGSEDMPASDKYTPMNHTDFKAMWLSQFDLESIYSINGQQTAKSVFKTKIQQVLDLVKKNGFNTVILQVRPYADSFYPSEYYPISKYVAGSYGNKTSYDPLPIIIEYAHSIDLSIHAWINPMRGMTEEEVKAIDESYLIKQWYLSEASEDSPISIVNDRLYLDPAYTEARELIINGVKEIIDNYSFDGVHMDDYFYPTTSADFDSASYKQYTANGGTESLKQFRYDNVNKLVSGIYSAVKAKNPELLFGISPEGNISNVTSKAFADVYTWMSEDGYIDYICPQLYYGLEHESLPFDKTLKKWESLIKNKNVRLIAGMTFGKALSKTDQWAGSGKNEWAEHNDVLKRCLESTRSVKKLYGISVFCFQYFYNPASFVEVSGTKTERDNFVPLLKDITWN